MKVVVALLFVTVALAGCASSPGLKDKFNSMYLYSPQKVVNTMGYPTRQFRAPNGNLVYAYTQSKSAKTSEHTYNYSALNTSTTVGGKSYTKSCTVFFEFYRNEMRKWSSQGSSCHL